MPQCAPVLVILEVVLSEVLDKITKSHVCNNVCSWLEKAAVLDRSYMTYDSGLVLLLIKCRKSSGTFPNEISRLYSMKFGSIQVSTNSQLNQDGNLIPDRPQAES